jgi:hypothetical protein
VDQESQLRESREETITLQRNVANLNRIGMEELEVRNRLYIQIYLSICTYVYISIGMK